MMSAFRLRLSREGEDALTLYDLPITDVDALNALDDNVSFFGEVWHVEEWPDVLAVAFGDSDEAVEGGVSVPASFTVRGANPVIYRFVSTVNMAPWFEEGQRVPGSHYTADVLEEDFSGQGSRWRRRRFDDFEFIEEEAELDNSYEAPARLAFFV
jgi:hypothetical protein